MQTVDVVIATPSVLALHEPTDYPRLAGPKGAVIVGGEVCPQGKLTPPSLSDFRNAR